MQCTDYFVSGEKFNIKSCDNCGLKITEDAEDESTIGKYYQSEKYISHSNTSKGLVNAIYQAVRTYMLGRKRRLVEKITGLATGNILDIGAGIGFFLNEMAQHGWHVSGTEKSEAARNFASENFTLSISPVETLFEMKSGHFDVITLWHVLEHVQQLNVNFEKIKELLKPDGKLLIAVPNNTSYDAQHYKEYWAAWDVPRHLWHFGPAQMKLLGEKHKMKLKSMHTMPFDAFYVSILSEKYKKSKLALLKGFFYGKLSWWKSISKPGNCSSLIYVFERNEFAEKD
ncbi:MAG: methyltransferase [Draconibacterium sp.]|nr:MAG: methyltransferase [Draconibacterium sp.]